MSRSRTTPSYLANLTKEQKVWLREHAASDHGHGVPCALCGWQYTNHTIGWPAGEIPDTATPQEGYPLSFDKCGIYIPEDINTWEKEEARDPGNSVAIEQSYD